MQKLTWTTQQRKVNDLIPLDFNPRKISEAKRMKMIESLQRFNLVDIPVVDFDNTLVSGHRRIQALQAIGRGEETIDVRYPNRKLTDRELKEYNLLANSHFGEWDNDIFDEYFADVDVEALGFSVDDFKLPDLSIIAQDEEIDYSEKNRELDTDSFFDEMEMKFKFSKDDFMDVQERLNIVCSKQNVDTKEDALRELLMFYERHSS